MHGYVSTGYNRKQVKAIADWSDNLTFESSEGTKREQQETEEANVSVVIFLEVPESDNISGADDPQRQTGQYKLLNGCEPAE